MDLVCSDPAHLVTSFTNGQIGLFNMETRQLVLTLESTLEPSKERFTSRCSFSFRKVSPNTFRTAHSNGVRCSRGNRSYSLRLPRTSKIKMIWLFLGIQPWSQLDILIVNPSVSQSFQGYFVLFNAYALEFPFVTESSLLSVRVTRFLCRVTAPVCPPQAHPVRSTRS